MSPNRRLQLIIVTTVIKDHLSDLEHALNAFGKYQKRTFDDHPSERFHLSVFGALEAFMRNLLSKTIEILR